VAKVGTSNPDRTISLKRLECVVENKHHKHSQESARPRPTALLPPSPDGKPEAATAVFVAPDDGHEDA